MEEKRQELADELFTSSGSLPDVSAPCQINGDMLIHAGTGCAPEDDAPLALLLGVAVGDALGVPVEFRARGTFHVTGMQGYGTHNQPPGTWSDDTSLTLALADALLPDQCSMERIAAGFRNWYFHAAYTAHGKVFDVGNATARAIRRLQEGCAPEKAGGSGEQDNGNGSLMRIAPLVFFLSGTDDPRTRFALVKKVSSITHAHSWSVAACFLYIELLDKILKGRSGAAGYEELKEEFRHHSFLHPATLARFDRLLKGDIRRLAERDIRSSGFVVDTLEAAVWCFLTTDNYRDAVLKAVNLGEDTDTTGAVTGALAGLAYGTRGIPGVWRRQLAGIEEIRRIALGLSRKAVCREHPATPGD